MNFRWFFQYFGNIQINYEHFECLPCIVQYDENSENYTINDEQEDYGNIISLINDYTPFPKFVELI